MSKLVLVSQWSEDDGWYGKNYRALLSKTETEGFKHKTEAQPYAARLRKYVKQHFGAEVKTVHMTFGPEDSYVEYTYCSCGPSLCYQHYLVTVAQLDAQQPKK